MVGVTLPGCGSMLTSPGFQPHLMTMNQLYQTGSSAVTVHSICFDIKRKKSLMEDERKIQGMDSADSSEPQKAHLTGEFAVVTKNGGHALLSLGSILLTVISE